MDEDSVCDGGTEEDRGKHNNKLGTGEGADNVDTQEMVPWTM